MKNYNLSIVVLLFFLFPGCKKVKIKSNFSRLHHKTLVSTGSEIILDNKIRHDIRDIHTNKDTTDHRLSRNEAVAIAFQNNPELQADFQNLGIAKSDLVQAGLYTNPSINSVFRFPTHNHNSGTSQTNIECVGAVRLSDLWQVPLTKRVAEDLLEIVSLRIFSTILTTAFETKIAYDQCLAAKLYVQNTKNLLATTQELRDEIYYRQLYGYTSDLDKNLIDAKVSKLESTLKQQEAALSNAYIHLKKLMGLTPSSTSIMLIDTLYENITVPELNVMEEYALANRPEIHTAFMKIRQYKDTIRLEKSKLFKFVDIGIGYKQDFEKHFSGWGPYLNFDLPIFNDNYAQVARAEFLLKQAEQELIAERIKILEELNNPYRSFKALEQEIILYKDVILPSHQKAIEYAYTYAETMQLSMVVALESKVQFYEGNSQLIDKFYHAKEELARLERALGEDIKLFNEKINSNAPHGQSHH